MTELREFTPVQLSDLDNITIQIFETIVADGFLSRDNQRDEAYISRQPAKDIDDFFPLLKTAFNSAQRAVPIKDRVTLIEDSPPKDLKTETITFKLKSRLPGAQSGSMPDIISGGSVVREWRPRMRYWYNNPENPQKRTVVMGQHFDNVIELNCWALTNKAANERAKWLEDLMQTYWWYFKYHGVNDVIFLGRTEDSSYESNMTQGNELKSRSLKYYIRTDKTFEISESILRDIVISMAVVTD